MCKLRVESLSVRSIPTTRRLLCFEFYHRGVSGVKEKWRAETSRRANLSHSGALCEKIEQISPLPPTPPISLETLTLGRFHCEAEIIKSFQLYSHRTTTHVTTCRSSNLQYTRFYGSVVMPPGTTTPYDKLDNHPNTPWVWPNPDLTQVEHRLDPDLT